MGSRFTWLLVGLVVGTAAPAGAQPEGDRSPSGLEEPAAPVRFTVEFRAEAGTSADLNVGPGDVALHVAGVRVGMTGSAGKRGQIAVSLDYELARYDFRQATGLVPGTDSLWDDTHAIAVGVRYLRQATERLAWFAGGSVRLGAEDGGDLAEGLVGSALAGARYSFSPSLTLGLGAGVRTRLEDDPLVYPLPIIHWRIAERWTLSAGDDAGVALSYAPSERWTVTLAGAYDLRDFRLADDGPVPDGAARHTRLPVTLGVVFTPTPRLRLHAAAGYVFAQTIEVFDAGGTEIADTDPDGAAFLRLAFGYQF